MFHQKKGQLPIASEWEAEISDHYFFTRMLTSNRITTPPPTPTPPPATTPTPVSTPSPTIFSRIKSLLGFGGVVAESIEQNSLQQVTPKDISTALVGDFKQAVLDPGNNGEFLGLRNAIEHGTLPELVATLNNPPLKTLPLASMLSGGLCADDLLHTLSDGTPIIVHYFDKIIPILQALQASRKVLSPEDWEKRIYS